MADIITKTRFISHTSLYLALAALLPVAFHAFGIGGRVFLPMHIPVLLAGFLCGPFSGLIVGLLGPIISHLLTGMPPTYAVPLMTMELSIYGMFAGVMYYRLKMNIYFSLIIAMVVGRLVFGFCLLLLGRFMELPYSAAEFFAASGAIVTGLPGIVVQLFLVPVIVAAIKRGK